MEGTEGREEAAAPVLYPARSLALAFLFSP